MPHSPWTSVLLVALLGFSLAFSPFASAVLAKDGPASDASARARLEKSLQKLAALKSLAYEATSEIIEVDLSQAAPATPIPNPGRIAVAAATAPDPATAPRTRSLRSGRVLWQRLPDSPDDEPRVRFSLTGTVQISSLPPQKPAAPAANAPAKPPAKVTDSAKKPTEETDKSSATEVPLRAAFNGQVLRIVQAPQLVVQQYKSDEGELPPFQSSHVAALLQMPFASPSELVDNWPPETRFRDLPPTKIDGVECPGVEVLTRLVSDTELQTGSRASSPTLIIRYHLDPESDLPRRISTSALQMPGSKGEPVFTTVDFTNLQPNAPISEIAKPDTGFDVAIPELYDLQEFEPDVQSQVETGDDLPEVTLTDRSGKERRLTEFRGQLVLIEFWASWSPLSRLSLPGTQQLHDEFGKKGLQVIALSIDVEDELVDARKFLDDKKFTFLSLFDGSDFAEDLGLKTLPHLILLDRAGKVLYQHTGDSPQAEKRLRRRIVEQLSPRN
ncbi:MAG: TlpA family protein disulfide reductase [Planctomycetaceae bacterium]|jgi:peroxiredoxin